MKTYNCHVRPGGRTSTEVPKYGLPAAEIILLRHIHGNDAVVRIGQSEVVPEDHEDGIRGYLRANYELAEHQAGLINSVFGPEHMPVPMTLDSATEAAIAEGIKAKDAMEAERKANVEAEVERRVEAEVKARLAGDKLDKVNAGANEDKAPTEKKSRSERSREIYKKARAQAEA